MIDSLHPSFIQPEDRNSIVWRYLNLPKFLSMVQTRSLYMARVDQLKDKNEGSLTRYDFLQRNVEIQNIDSLLEEEKRYILDSNIMLNRSDRYCTYVNCWNMNEHESAIMWREYGNNEDGIVIQSKYKRLIESYKGELKNIFIGKVIYRTDMNTSQVSLNRTLFDKFMCKGVYFEHENEIRVIHWPASYKNCENKNGFAIDLDEMQSSNPIGIYIEVDLETLIEEIYVNPYAPSWYFDIILEICKIYLPKVKVRWSNFKRDIYY